MRTALAVSLLLALSAPDAVAKTAGSESHGATVLEFTESVANVECISEQLNRAKPKIAGRGSMNSTGTVWYGRIRRRLPDDPPFDAQHDVALAVAYLEDRPVSIWCDLNLNGNLSDDPPVPMYLYPDPPGSRAGIVDLHWEARHGAERVPIAWKLRIVVEPVAWPDTLPRYRTQRVLAMTGTVEVDGAQHRAFLFDGDGDGIYTKGFGDGIFIDTDDDRELAVDPASTDFLPFGAPAQIGSTRFETVTIASNGSRVTVDAEPGQLPQKQPDVGEMAPDFGFESADGQPARLSDFHGKPVILYFWAAWCGSCEERAPKLRAIYDRFHPRGLEIVGVSFDEDRTRMGAFRTKHHEPWPVSYTGRAFWENPIGRLYGVSATGSAYLINGDGKYEGKYYDLESLEERVGELLAPVESRH